MLLIPGYVASSFLAPFMGRIADRHGARIIATLGIIVQLIGVLVYITLNPSSIPIAINPIFQISSPMDAISTPP